MRDGEVLGGAEEVRGDEEVRGGWVPETMLPDRLRGSRFALSPRHVVVVALVLVIGLAWAGCSVLRARPQVVPDPQPSAGLVPGTPVTSPPGASPAATPSGSAAVVVVHVAGKVRRPGLVRAKPGSRVADVLAMAGGALPGVDLTTLNLARPVTDGEQILVGVSGAPQPTGTQLGSPTTPGTTTGEPLNLNTATLAQLDSLPGVGPVLAQRILDWRTEHGRFTSVDELQEVTGVGTKKFESLKPHVHV
jgi:competence protein ComEA